MIHAGSWRHLPESAVPAKPISLYARDSRERRDESHVSSLRIAPIAPVVLGSLAIHEQRFTSKSSGSGIVAEALRNNVGEVSIYLSTVRATVRVIIPNTVTG